MPNIHFYLKPGQQNKAGEKPVVMRITYNRTRTVIFINCKVHPKFWNSNRQVVRPPNSREPANNHEYINETMRIYRNKAEEAIHNALMKDMPLTDAYFKNWFKGKQRTSQKSFFEWMDEYIESAKPDKARRTVRGYMTVRSFLVGFEKDSRTKIDFSELDMGFFDRFKSYAFLKRRVQDNYFAKIIHVLKAFLAWAKDRGAPVNDLYRKFHAAEREKEIIFLSMDELMTLYEFDFKNKRLSQARDLYCFGCFTGLRVADILDLRRAHIKDNTIQKTIIKTRVSETIPLNPFALQILEKYKEIPDRALPRISDQKLNDYIKECCQIAGIDTPTTITRFFGGKVEEVTLPKYKFITTHTARKTFLTNSIILGMNYMAARGISGHKRDKNFNRYVKIAEEFKKKEMERTWGNLSKKVGK